MLPVVTKSSGAMLALLLLTTAPASAALITQTNLVSNVPGLATITDPLLVNPWGFSHSATSPFWTSNQGSNSSTLYNVTGPTGLNVVKNNIAPNGFVAIPTIPGGPNGPTGQVFNPNATGFLVGNGGNGNKSNFIFANLNGTISAWNTGPTAIVQATVQGAVYTSLAINQASTQLFAANVASGAIDVFNSSFGQVAVAPGAFATPPAISALGLIPFNTQDIGGKLYVTYAPQGLAAQQNAVGGQGAIAVFDETTGLLLNTIINGQLASPWGITVAPAGFGNFGGALLVGNFSFLESEINAFDSVTNAFLGSIPINTGSASAGGLWAIGFGTGGNNGSPNTLYFLDGINGETGGLFGAITAVPEPATVALFSMGMMGLGLMMARRRKTKTL